jgi:hypothetical protein
MTTALMNGNYRSGLLAIPEHSSGQGRDAFWMSKSINEARQHFLTSVSLRSAVGAALDELLDAALEASAQGWDGYGARPVDPKTYARARRFIQALPTTVPKPEIGVDSDGEVSLDWLFGAGLVFSVSVGPSARLTFASLMGKRAIQGTEWLNDGIPAALLDELTRVATEARRLNVV